MKLEVKENMYYRTRGGAIEKIVSLEDFNEREYKLNGFYIDKVAITKASYNIIDILEEGDYVNGQVVTQIIPNNRKIDPSTMIYTGTNYVVGLYNEDIENVRTKEQMEQISYKIGE